MGIEESLNRIAEALEQTVKLREQGNAMYKQMLEYAEWNRQRLGEKLTTAPAASDTAPVAPAPKAAEPVAVQEAPAPSYDELKARLLRKGCDIPKGTKMTTLLKLWAEHKDDPDAPAETPVTEAEKPAEADIFSEAQPKVKPMTMEAAREILTKEFTSCDADRALLRAALAQVGAEKFSAVQDYDELVAVARKLKAEAGR